MTNDKNCSRTLNAVIKKDEYLLQNDYVQRSSSSSSKVAGGRIRLLNLTSSAPSPALCRPLTYHTPGDNADHTALTVRLQTYSNMRRVLRPASGYFMPRSVQQPVHNRSPMHDTLLTRLQYFNFF